MEEPEKTSESLNLSKSEQQEEVLDDLYKNKFMGTMLRQFGCTDEVYEQTKKQILEEQRTKPFRSKLKFWLWLLFLAAIVFSLFLIWKFESI